MRLLRLPRPVTSPPAPKLALAMLLAVCGARAADAQEAAPFDALDLSRMLAPAELAAKLAADRVVFVGETHTRYADHLNQLEIIEQLHARDPDLAIGVEYFQKRFQRQVDDYIAGRSTESEFLRDTEYFRRWGYDYRLYAPIFRFAREQHIPVRALNVPSSLPSAVAKVGLDGLSKAQRAELPRKIEPASEAYKARLREAFAGHGGQAPGDFEHFVEAQLVWDEGMAESAADYLEAHPGRRMIILAGAGHLEFGSGIPSRLARRTHATYAVVLGGGEGIEPHAADYVLLGDEKQLPPAGVLGVQLADEQGRCVIRALATGGAAQKSGLKKGDVLGAVDGRAVSSVADVRLALWDKRPGDRVRVTARRKRVFRTVERDVEVALEAPGGS